MKKYKVLAPLNGTHKVFNARDEITADQLPEGNADVLVKKGFLEPISAKKAESKSAENESKSDSKKTQSKSGKSSKK
jgi:hypothetical protein